MTSSPTLTYSNLLLFTNASFYLLIYNINVTFSPTLTHFNLFHFTNASFHFLVYNLNITFLLHLRIPISSSSLLITSLQCGVFSLKFEFRVLLVARLVRVVLFKKQDILDQAQMYLPFFYFWTFFSLFSFQFLLHSASSIDIT